MRIRETRLMDHCLEAVARYISIGSCRTNGCQMIFGTPADKVERFFAKHGKAWLVLPDGWYGRPFDSLFALSLVRGFPDRLQIELEGDRKLSFQGSIVVESSHYEKYPSIEISGFESDLWVPNSGVYKEHVYRNDGSVVFASM